MLIGVVAAVLIGGGVATGATYALIQSNDPDSAAQVQQKLHAPDKYNPGDHPNKIYGNR